MAAGIKPKRIGCCEAPWSIFGRRLVGGGERQLGDDTALGDGSIVEIWSRGRDLNPRPADYELSRIRSSGLFSVVGFRLPLR